ncbi:MAG TPA: hypothetical protein VF838_07465 [Trebonia sp.]
MTESAGRGPESVSARRAGTSQRIVERATGPSVLSIAAADARRVPRLAAGAFVLVLGLVYRTVARRTRSIRWTIASHTLAGLGLVASTRLLPGRAAQDGGCLGTPGCA